MLRNHELFVCGYDVDRNAALRQRYRGSVPGVLRWIKRRAKPSEPFCDPRADADRVLTNACGKHKGINALHRSRQHSGMQGDPVDEVVDGEGGTGIFRILKLPHVVADPGKAL